MHKIFYMMERTFDGKTHIDMIIDDPDLRKLLLDQEYSSLSYEDGLNGITEANAYDISKYMKPIVSCPSERSENCLRIDCDRHYAAKVNKASHIIMNYHSEHSI